MQKLTLTAIILFLVFTGTGTFGQKANTSFPEIYKLIEQKDYFNAKEMYEKRKESLPAGYRHFTKAFIENAFNRPAESQACITWLADHHTEIPDSLLFRMYLVNEDNAIKICDYKAAEKAVTTVLDSYGKYLTGYERDDYSNNRKIWKALRDVPPQQVTISDNTNLKMEKDIAGFNNLKVSVAGDTINFIFDTGANFSTTTFSVAERMKMKIINADIEVGSITGQKVVSQLAVCDKFSFGNIEVRNAVFLVLPDSALSFPQISYQIFGVLGFPVIEALREIQITRDGHFIVPKSEIAFAGNSNMALDGLTPLILLNGRHFSFDTGADKTILYQSFYLAHKDYFDHNYTQAKTGMGGAGGKIETQAYIIDQAFTVSGKEIILKDVTLLMDKIKEDEDVYGNIGQDLIGQFSKMTLNFDRMFIEFE